MFSKYKHKRGLCFTTLIRVKLRQKSTEGIHGRPQFIADGKHNTHIHGVERPVLCDLELGHEQPLAAVVDAHVLGVSRRQKALAVGGVAQSAERPVMQRWWSIEVGSS